MLLEIAETDVQRNVDRARVIYYHVSSAAQIRLLLIYAKGRKDDLSADEKRVLRSLNERW